MIVQSQINRVLAMQEHMGQIEEELKWAKERLVIVESERNEAREIKRETSPKKIGELLIEIKTMKELLTNAQKELSTKDKDIESLKIKLDESKRFEIKLAEMEVSFNELNRAKASQAEAREKIEIKLAEMELSFNELKEELNRTKTSEDEARAINLNLNSQSEDKKRRIDELEDEVQKGKVLEAHLMDSLASLAKRLEQTKIELEESKLEIASLRDEIRLLSDKSSSENSVIVPVAAAAAVVGENESRKNELGLKTEEDDKAKNVIIDQLRNELRLSLEAEEKSKKAMDDLAMALKEVASEANRAKQKINSTQLELEQVKGEAEKLKEMIRSSEEKYQKLVEDARVEAEVHRNTADRLRSEAEESLLAWNGKETCLVSCIKRAENEKSHAQQENARLVESMKIAERVAISSREESFKVRDILKQAINEANAAKAAAGIARDENSHLKDSIAEKDEALHFLTQENERLRLSEVAAYENLKEFKRLLATASTELKPIKDRAADGRSRNLTEEERENEEEEEEKQEKKKKVENQRSKKKNFSFNLDELKLFSDENEESDSESEEDPKKAEALKGSIFDTAADSPRSEPKTPKAEGKHHRRDSSPLFTVEGETLSQDELEHIENGHYEDAENNDRYHKRRRALFRRVGDLIMMRRTFHRKEPSLTSPLPSLSPPTPTPSSTTTTTTTVADQ